MGLGACSGVHTPADQGNRAAKLRFDRCVPTQEFIHDNGINAQPTVKNSKQEHECVVLKQSALFSQLYIWMR